MTKKISIKDIAKELELSITTVAFVINGKGEEIPVDRIRSPYAITEALKLLND